MLKNNQFLSQLYLVQVKSANTATVAIRLLAKVGLFRLTAQTHIGTANTLEAVKEERIEVVCEREKAKATIEAMKQVHPYEEVPFDIYPLLKEEEL